MPLIFALLAGGGLGAFFGSQADDAIETVTGEKGGIPFLGLAILAVAGFFIFRRLQK